MLGSKLDIMNNGWLNLVFANRNQAYGAYALRQDNARNTRKALFIALSVFVVGLASPTIANIIRGYIPDADPKVIVFDNKILPPPTSIAKVTPPPVVHEAPRPHNDVVRFPPPIVKPDIEAQHEPPTDEKLQTADVGVRDLKGDKNAPLVDVDVEHGTADPNAAITEAPADNTVFSAVEVEPSPIGGIDKFYSFLGNRIKYPVAAKEAGLQGKVILTFVVERDGSLTDIKAIRDPGSGLGDEAIRVLKLAPHWSPGIQNGKKVRVQYTIPVAFSLGEQ
jgi:protein TonB